MSKQKGPIPRHISFIVDGNRRWAKARGKSSIEGYPPGIDAFKTMVRASFEVGVEYVSAFVFSTENWKREPKEVSFLMDYFVRLAKSELRELTDEGVKVLVVGRRDRLPKKVIKALSELEHETSKKDKGTLVLCIDYGGKQELVDAAKSIINSGVSAEDINVEEFEKHLYAPQVPPIDILVRTSGEHRISNYQLWQAAYAEFIFFEKNWPDMNEKDFQKILQAFQQRQRRFGN